jgi:hypothetical protein
MEPTDSQAIKDIFKEEELPFRESLYENISCSREAFHSLNSSTYFYLYPNLFNGLTLQETTDHMTQMDSIGLTHFEILDGDNVHTKDREDKTSSHELVTTKPYHPFSWDEENFVANVHQRMSSSFSYSFFINSESPCSSSLLLNIVNTSGSHHCFKIISHTMVGPNPYISYDLTSLSQVVGYLKCESREACQDNEALWSMRWLCQALILLVCLQG